jgi:hypothetical protein
MLWLVFACSFFFFGFGFGFEFGFGFVFLLIWYFSVYLFVLVQEKINIKGLRLFGSYLF